MNLLVINNIIFHDTKGWSQLHHACEDGEFEKVKDLVLKGANINLLTSDKVSDCNASSFHPF